MYKIHAIKGGSLELPTDLRKKATFWYINKGEGELRDGFPFEIEYNPENEDPTSFVIKHDKYSSAKILEESKAASTDTVTERVSA